jgi:hypothetical protein
MDIKKEITQNFRLHAIMDDVVISNTTFFHNTKILEGLFDMVWDSMGTLGENDDFSYVFKN